MQGDLRQALNLLQMWRTTTDTLDDETVEAGLHLSAKNLNLGANEIVPEMYPCRTREHKLSEKLDMYFMDYTMLPIMVHETYLATGPTLERAAFIAESISEGDLVTATIQKKQMHEYSLDFFFLPPLRLIL